MKTGQVMAEQTRSGQVTPSTRCHTCCSRPDQVRHVDRDSTLCRTEQVRQKHVVYKMLDLKPSQQSTVYSRKYVLHQSLFKKKKLVRHTQTHKHRHAQPRHRIGKSQTHIVEIHPFTKCTSMNHESYLNEPGILCGRLCPASSEPLRMQHTPVQLGHSRDRLSAWHWRSWEKNTAV